MLIDTTLPQLKWTYPGSVYQDVNGVGANSESLLQTCLTLVHVMLTGKYPCPLDEGIHIHLHTHNTDIKYKVHYSGACLYVAPNTMRHKAV